MKKLFVYFLALLSFYSVSAQDTARYKIALFTPLYLDSAFDASSNYRFDKSFPKYLNPGLEFYMGAKAALDSLNKMGAPLDVFIYDSRASSNFSSLVDPPELHDVDLYIAHASGTEVRTLAEIAERKKVPFISATLPSDAGIKENPYFVILNSTLQTHVEGMYRYLQRYHSLDKIIFFTKNGNQEAQIKDYFIEFSKTTTIPLNIRYENIGSNFDTRLLTNKIDSTRRTVCISGSLDENFGMRLMTQLNPAASSYPITVMGMPTWDGMNFSKNEINNLSIVYTIPFNYGRTSPLMTHLSTDFTNTQNGRPTDMFFRGYETTLRFALLLLDSKKDIASNLSRKGNYIFTSFDIQPIFRNNTLDYFENKKLYFIKVLNGVKNIQY